MRKKILLIIMCVVLATAVLCVACVQKKENKAENNDNEKMINTWEDIQVTLEKDEKTTDISWLENKTQVFFTKESGDYQHNMYSWKVGEEKEKLVNGVSGNIYDLSWSKDGRYITVNEGTGTIYTTIIITAEDIQIVDKIVNAGGPVWSLDCSKLAFAVLNDKEPSIAIEWDGTCDIMLYDIKTKAKRVVLKADNYFYYMPLAWDENGLKYEKCYFDEREREELNFKENDEEKINAAFDITSETYIEKNEKKNVEVEIKYPVIKNMADKDMEEKFNSLIKEKVNNYKTLYYEDNEAEAIKQTIFADYQVMKKTEDLICVRFFISMYS